MSGRYFVPHFKAEVGEFYYVVDCPVTGNPIPFERDPSHGRTPYPPGAMLVSCAYCQQAHQIANPKVSSHQAMKKE